MTPEQNREYQRKWAAARRATNPEKARAYDAQWRAGRTPEQKARKAAKLKEWRIKNKERLDIYKAVTRKYSQTRAAKSYQRNKEGIRLRAKKAWDARTPEQKEHAKKRAAEYYQKNKASQRSMRAEYRKKNTGKLSALSSAWKKSNADKVRHYSMKRIAAKMQAIPKWADISAIEDVYKEAEYFGLEVDHIVPLQSKIVCGLHVWDNLQLLTKKENIIKGNRHWPDMPLNEERIT